MVHPKHKKKVQRHTLRNAATVRAPEARAPRVRLPTATLISEGGRRTSWVPETLQTAFVAPRLACLPERPLMTYPEALCEWATAHGQLPLLVKGRFVVACSQFLSFDC